MDFERETQRPSGRLAYLDGLRGVAAFLVIIFHFFSAFVYWLTPGETPTPSWIADTPLAILYNGTFCVIVFFVLSGFVVSNSAIRSRDRLAVSVGLRYLRLALPVTASILFAWGLLRLMPNEASRAYAKIPHEWLTYSYQGKIPSIGMALSSGFFHTFVADESNWNNVLWTMKPELIGSCVLYAIFSATKGSMRLWTLLLFAVALIPAHQTLYEGFALGGILSELRSSGMLPTRFPIVALITGVLLGFEGHGFSSRFHLPNQHPIFTLGEKTSLWYAFGAMLIVYACLRSPALQSALSTRGVALLGRISFSMYLCHVPLLYTVFCWAYVAGLPMNAFKLAGMFLAFLSLSLVLGYFGTLAVDEPVLRLTKRLRERFRTAPVGVLVS